MTNLISALWGHLSVSEEEKEQARLARARADQQRRETLELTRLSGELDTRNGFGWKFHAALRERPR